MYSDIINFIAESNAIEGIEFDIEQYKMGINAETPLISDHIKAFNYLFGKMLGPNTLTELDIKKAHNILMRDQLPKDKRGKYRRRFVKIGNDISPEHKRVRKLMQLWLKGFNNRVHEHALRHHLQFEYIHPFVDGNGRIGRLLFLCDIIKAGQGVYNILDLFPGDSFKDRRSKYYNAIFKYSISANTYLTWHLAFLGLLLFILPSLFNKLLDL